jgi:cytochrome c2
VVTLDSLPRDVVAGRTFAVGFTVRQHGITPASNLEPPPSVEARNQATGESVRQDAEADGEAGHYAARIELPSSGEWAWGIRAFGDQLQPMPPIVVAPVGGLADGASAPGSTLAGPLIAAALALLAIVLASRKRWALAGSLAVLAVVAGAASFARVEPSPPSAEAAARALPFDEGKALFVAKGCVVCHVNSDVPESHGVSIAVGPDLSQYGNDPALLTRWLSDPRSVRPKTEMPDLALSSLEIEALIAFLNGDAG